MKPGEIWFISDPLLGNANHGHYILIVDRSRDDDNSPRYTIRFFWIATDRCNKGDFRIDEKHPDFAATGLNHTSHILEAREYCFEDEITGGKRGIIQAKLLQEITNWYRLEIVKGVKPEKKSTNWADQ